MVSGGPKGAKDTLVEQGLCHCGEAHPANLEVQGNAGVDEVGRGPICAGFGEGICRQVSWGEEVSRGRVEGSGAAMFVELACDGLQYLAVWCSQPVVVFPVGQVFGDGRYGGGGAANNAEGCIVRQ